MKKIVLFLLALVILSAATVQKQNSVYRSIRPENGDGLGLLIDTVKNGRIYYKEGISMSQDIFLKKYGFDLGLSINDSLHIFKVGKDTLGQNHYRYYQFHNGIKVDGTVFQVHEKNNSVWLSHGIIVKGIQAPSKPLMLEEDALASAMENIGAKLYAWQDTSWENDRKRELKDASASWFPKGSLVYVADADMNRDLSDGKNYKLAYKFIVRTLIPFDNIVVYIDAETLKCIDKGSLITSANGTVATVYNGSKPVTTHYRGIPNWDYVLRDKSNASEIIVRNYDMKSFGSTNDIDENNNQWGIDEDEHAASSLWAVASSYNVFKTSFGRTYGMRSASHQIRVFNYWPWETSFGADDLGDYIYVGIFNGNYDGYEGALDVLAHEFTHGVSTSACNLDSSIYNYECGAIFESFSDIFGEYVEYKTLGSTDWILGNDLISMYRRSFSNPHDYYPDFFPGDQYPIIYLDEDWDSTTYSAHINLMVQNRMFYLLSQGGVQNGVTVSAIGIEKAALIAYRAMTVFSDITTTWEDSRDNFYDAAKGLFGTNSCEARETRNAWAAVGIGTASYDSCYPPVSATISGPPYICFDGDGNYTANPTGGTGNYTYSWYVDYGAGWTYLSSDPSVTLWGDQYPMNSPLNLILDVTSGPGQCTVYKNIVVYDCGYGRGMGIFPNPANDILNISFSGNSNDANYTDKNDVVNVEIISSTGKIYYKGLFGSNGFVVPVANIPEGLCIVSVSMGGKKYSQQIIIRH